MPIKVNKIKKTDSSIASGDGGYTLFMHCNDILTALLNKP
jgi:hypothetical protein